MERDSKLVRDDELFPRSPLIESVIESIREQYKKFDDPEVFQEELFQNPFLSASHKLVLWKIRQMMLTASVDESRLLPIYKPVLIYMPEIAKKTGLGESTVRRLLDELDSGKVISKGVKRWRKDGQWKTEVRISFQESFMKAPASVGVRDRSHGESHSRKNI